MTDPRRLLESGAAEPEVLALLAQAAPPRPLTPEQYRQSAARVARVARVPLAAAALLWWARQAAYPLRAGRRLAAAALAIALVGVALPQQRQLASEPRPTAAAVLAVPRLPRVLLAPPPGIAPPAAAAPGPAPAPAAPGLAPAADAVRIEPPSAAGETSRASTRARAPKRASDDFSAEVRSLEDLRQALERDPQGALDGLEQHRRRFARPVLPFEADLLQIQALLRLGQRPAAVQLGRALLKRSPDTLYRTRLRALLGAEAVPD